MKTSAGQDAALTLLAPVAWGTTYLTISELLPADRPLLVATGRVLPAGVLLVVIGRLRCRSCAALPWRRTVVLALCNFALFFPLLTAAAYRLPGGVAAAVGAVQPMLVAVLTWAGGANRPRRSELLVAAIAAAGVALVVVRPGAQIDVAGVLFAVAANVSFAVGVVLTRRWGRPADPLGAAGRQMLVAATVLAPLALAIEGPPPVLGVAATAGLAYLSLVATGLAFALWFRGVRLLPATAPPLLGLAGPITGAVLGWAVLGQSLTVVQLAGFVVTVGAISWGATAGRRSDQRPIEVGGLPRGAARAGARASSAPLPVALCGSNGRQ